MESPPPHILILPYPVQGHVMPFMELARRLVHAGLAVTFVNTNFNHHRLLHANAGNSHGEADGASLSTLLRLVGIPDGLDSDGERNNIVRICQAVPLAMEASLDEIMKTAADGDRPFTWMITDQNMAWALPLASKRGLRTAVFWPASAAMLAIMLNIPRLIEAGLIDKEGLPKKDEIFELAPGMPELPSTQLAWNLAGNTAAKSAVFSFVLTNNRATADHAELIIFNTFVELESQALSLIPASVPIGPLLSSDHRPAGHLWPPESASAILGWLDSRSVGSVLYVAFGSHTVFSKAQIEEIGYGLEETGMPFLWAIRPDLTSTGRGQIFTPEFMKRVEGRALLVGWAPQQLILAHPSIGCFMSHCGWNSTLEGVRSGLRFLCWPYFTDQFLNQSYICDRWRIGLRVGPDENEVGGGVGGEAVVVTRERIRKRVEEVMGDGEMRKRALMWKEKAVLNVSPNGSSYENFHMVINKIRKNGPHNA